MRAAESDDDAAADEDGCFGIGGNGLSPLISTATIESSVSLRMMSLGVAPALDCLPKDGACQHNGRWIGVGAGQQGGQRCWPTCQRLGLRGRTRAATML